MMRLSKQDRRLFERHFAGKLFEYLDRGYGDCSLRDQQVRKIVYDSLLFFNSDRLDTGDFVVMPNHVHAIITPYIGHELEHILHSIKSFTANKINKLLNRSGTLWMEESYDHIVRDGEELLRIQHYIRANPEKARSPEHEFDLYETEYELTD